MSIGLVLRISLGFLLIVTLAYASISLEEVIKKESQKQTLVTVAEYTANNILVAMQYVSTGESVNQTYRLPMSRDYYTGQYWVQLEDINGVAYVTTQSVRWPSMIARHPLFLNTTSLDMDTQKITPPGLCVSVARNNTHYELSINC